jgi:hypothetical protein
MKHGGLIGMVLLLAGCATMQGKRRQFVVAHPDLNDAQKNAVLNGEIVAGMTEDMVRASWGQPLDIVQELIEGQQRVSWIYQQSGDDHVNTYRVRFADGRVNDVRLINTQRRVYSVYHQRYWWRYYPELP